MSEILRTREYKIKEVVIERSKEEKDGVILRLYNLLKDDEE